MKHCAHLLLAVAGLSIAAPAAARDGSPYVGVEVGALKVRDGNYRYQGTTGTEDADVRIDHNIGEDADIVLGYDFGMLRAEAEFGYKRAGNDEVLVTDGTGTTTRFVDGNNARGKSTSIMGNVLFDFGRDDGINFYAGGGAGMARTSYKVLAFDSDPDANFAWQLIAGARMPVSDNVDVGVKYRYFQTKFNVEPLPQDELIGKWRSHSLLASLTYNFGRSEAEPVMAAPAPVMAPVGPAPVQTQTCYDGSVILATDACPLPPAPAPVPSKAGERG